MNVSYMIKGNHNQIIVKINMLQYRTFSFSFHYEENRALKTGYDDDYWLCHIKYGHLNVKWLKLLHNKQMVKGLFLIDCVD